MPKKTATPHSRAQRNRPKAQKTFELVRPERAVPETEEIAIASASASAAVTDQEEPRTSGKASTTAAVQAESKTSKRVADVRRQTPSLREEAESNIEARQPSPAPRSASARPAAGRQATQRLQRSVPTLITSEHFAYVRKDLIRIAVFAAILFTAIIVLYLTLGRA